MNGHDVFTAPPHHRRYGGKACNYDAKVDFERTQDRRPNEVECDVRLGKADRKDQSSDVDEADAWAGSDHEAHIEQCWEELTLHLTQTC